MIFRQLFEKASSTYTYLLADEASRKALVIDPVLETVERDLLLLQELGLNLVYALETHTHADHITGAGRLRQLSACQIGVALKSGVSGADLYLQDGDRLQLGELELAVIATPGHTEESLSFLTGKREMVFTGDTLLVRGCGRTDFQNGDPLALYASVTEKLFSLPDATLVYPGHDYKGHLLTTIGEEKRLNPRLTLSRDDFVKFMNQLHLPPPQRMNEAVPANLRCGLS